MTSQATLNRLYDYILAIRDDQGSLELFKAHELDIKSLSTLDLFDLFNRVLEVDEPKEILPYLDKLIHIFAQGLAPKQRSYPEGSILSFLHQENEAMKLKLTAIQTLMHASLQNVDPKVLLPLFTELQDFTPHYVKIQNVLFPHLEKVDERCTALKIMWSLQDQTKANLKQIVSKLVDAQQLDDALIISIGNYFFAAYGLIQKEELILFQVALDLLTPSQLEQVEIHCAEFEACFIPPLPKRKSKVAESPAFFFNTETGYLTKEQLILVLSAIPLDITLIDEHDKVSYFNNAKDRLFPRSAAVIGRDVRNCHPAESVHVVNEILSAFRNKTRDEAKFWIHMKNKFVYIKYVALRDPQGSYKGCLEITQEISEIHALKGDRRLLDWD